MANSAEYVSWVVDQLSDFAHIKTKRLFGGNAVLKDDLNFGLIFADELYLKVDEHNKPMFADVQSEQFTYEKGNKTIYVSFWTVPETVIEDTEDLAVWASAAYEAALRVKRPKPKKSKA